MATADPSHGGCVALLAPLGGDAGAIAAELAALGLTPRPCANAAALDALLSAPGEDEILFVVVTHEGAGAEVGAALQRAFDREPSWSRLPVVFLVADSARPPEACVLLDRKENAPPFVMLERPVRPQVLRRILETQAEARRRQRETGALIARLRAAEARQRFLLEELRHRTMNSFAVLQGVFHAIARRTDSAETLRAAFESRLQALTRAHAALSSDTGERRDLAGLLREHVEPVCAESDRLRTAGPEVRLAPRFAFDLALVFHELAINAAKYGALSAPAGVVDAVWRWIDADTLEITWTERGGPPVTPPAETGLGSKVTGRLPAAQAEVETRFEPEGLVWRARIGAEALAAEPGA